MPFYKVGTPFRVYQSEFMGQPKGRPYLECKIKKSPNLAVRAENIIPPVHLYRGGVQISWQLQVFWLPAHPIRLSFPSILYGQWQIQAFVPGYSGASATASTVFPLRSCSLTIESWNL